MNLVESDFDGSTGVGRLLSPLPAQMAGPMSNRDRLPIAALHLERINVDDRPELT